MHRCAMGAALVVALAGSAFAVRIGGGTRPADDCLVEFDVVGRPEGRTLSCTDCDPSCDRDGVPTANGWCTFDVAVCFGRSRAGCVAAPVDRIRGSHDLELPGVGDECGVFNRTSLIARDSNLRRRTLAVTALAGRHPRRRDRNRLRLRCLARPPGEACPTAEVRAPCDQSSVLRNVYFGDLHVHTAYSFDAAVFGVRTTPLEAYRFARGAPLLLPPLDAAGIGTQVVQLDRPLDFAAVTDHSEFLGRGCRNRTGPGCAPSPEEAWHRTLAAADAAYDRTSACTFTTFPAYEYTANDTFSTRHRNVIFRTERVPFPISYFDEPTPQGLWRELARTCLDAGIGCDALAIPHNPNESNGNAFFVEYPGAAGVEQQREQAARRAAFEPLIEIYQHKGDSECMNGLAGIIGAPDEQCDFEKVRRAPFEDCGDGRGSGGALETGCVSRLDYLRGVLLAGLREQDRIGVNPYRLGVVASTDSHNGTAGAVDEDRFIGHRGVSDDTATERLAPVQRPVGPPYNPGGLAAVWAEENTRSSLFDALRRREVYGTSGPRITLRFFGGWGLDGGLCASPNLVEQAYNLGVPMGTPLAPATAAAPSFVAAALRDPGSATREGTPLARLQIVKGWLRDGEMQQQVYDVAGAPNGQGTVDPDTCVTTAPRQDSLCAVWTDPHFDPSEQAFYYARVLEAPTCRWTARDCNTLPVGQRPASCDDPTVPRTIQERAWSSPIWYVRAD